jgi:hypothetical protein
MLVLFSLKSSVCFAPSKLIRKILSGCTTEISELFNQATALVCRSTLAIPGTTPAGLPPAAGSKSNSDSLCDWIVVSVRPSPERLNVL